MIAAERRQIIPFPAMHGDDILTFPPRPEPYRVISFRVSYSADAGTTDAIPELTLSLLPATSPILIAQWANAANKYAGGSGGSIVFSSASSQGNTDLLNVSIPHDLWVIPGMLLQFAIVNGTLNDVVDSMCLQIEPSAAH